MYALLKQAVNRVAYSVRGSRPWSRGYAEHKRDFIEAVLRDGSFNREQLPAGYGRRFDERVVEYPWLISRLESGSGGHLWDAGSALNHDYLLRQKVLSDRKIFVSTFAPEPNCYWKNAVSYVFEDLRQTAFRDAFFDEVACLSTLEHIGLDNSAYDPADQGRRQEQGTHLQAVRELRRVLKEGGRLFLSFPYGLHRNHGWFQVFDAEMIDQVVQAFAPSSLTETYFRHTSDGWITSSRGDASQATYYDVHAEREPAPDFAAASRAVACLEMRK